VGLARSAIRYRVVNVYEVKVLFVFGAIKPVAHYQLADSVGRKYRSFLSVSQTLVSELDWHLQKPVAKLNRI